MNEERQLNDIAILDFSPALSAHFARLNRAWIERYFTMEPLDHLLLENPETEIIAKGGAVLFAADAHGAIVGTVALKNEGDGVFELSKMGVDEGAQGRGVGRLLGEAALARARAMGARKIILYTNSVLAPAIRLYRRLGFRDVPVMAADYTRADVKMELDFE